jgi:hypothetical protein
MFIEQGQADVDLTLPGVIETQTEREAFSLGPGEFGGGLLGECQKAQQ